MDPSLGGWGQQWSEEGIQHHLSGTLAYSNVPLYRGSLPPGDVSSLHATSAESVKRSHTLFPSSPPVPELPTLYRGGHQAWKAPGLVHDHIASEWQA